MVYFLYYLMSLTNFINSILVLLKLKINNELIFLYKLLNEYYFFIIVDYYYFINALT